MSVELVRRSGRCLGPGSGRSYFGIEIEKLKLVILIAGPGRLFRKLEITSILELQQSRDNQVGKSAEECIIAHHGIIVELAGESYFVLCITELILEP